MKVYKPVYTNKWEIHELDSDLLRRLPTNKSTVCYYKKNVGFYGSLYNTDNIFKTRESAHRWIYERVVSYDDLYYKGGVL